MLKQGTAYSVYTWRAHSHSSTSQDTETPVTIDWSKLTAPPAPRSHQGHDDGVRQGRQEADHRQGRHAGGHPEVERRQACGQGHRQADQQGQEGRHQVGEGQHGKAVVKLPKLKAGTWKATVVYAGSDDFTSAKKVVTFKVKKSKKK